jgi:hypothetical protein
MEGIAGLTGSVYLFQSGCVHYRWTWAMLIKRGYEVASLSCPRCGGRMKIVAFIEPPPGEVIEKILLIVFQTEHW